MESIPVPVDTVARLVATAESRCGGTVVVAVDGPSGAGKTTFAEALAARLGAAQIVHMDDLYPGWDGLRAAVPLLVDSVLAPLRRGEPASYRRFDWERGEYAQRHVVPAAPVLIVEGVGSAATPCADYESVIVWLDAERGVRMRRGLTRDGETFRPHWERWARQEKAHFAADRTRERADLAISTAVMLPDS